MKKRMCQPGYTMFLALAIMAMTVVLISMLADKSGVHVSYIKTMLDKEKAKTLALSGVQVAMSQLSTMHELPEKDFDEKSEKKDKKKTDPVAQKREFLKNILPVINSWQTFKLTKKRDGVKGSIRVCIGCEDGKINLNRMFDFVHKKFANEGSGKGDYKKIMQQIFEALKSSMGGEDLFDKFEKFLKERQNELCDPTELLTIEDFKIFKDKIFYEPVELMGDKKKEEKRTVYLSDIFTLWSGSRELDVWLLSHSLKVLFGLKTKKKDDDQFSEEKLKNLLKDFNDKLSWPDSWKKFFAPLYGVKFEGLSKEVRALFESQGIFLTKFEPKVFSVLSYGSVGGVTQKLLIIVERTKKTTQEQSGSETSFEFGVKKFYWM